jgi:hypothetical protein
MLCARVLLASFLFFVNSLALACSCNKSNVEAVAHTSDIVFTKVRLSKPSITERVRSLLPTSNRTRIYAVEIVENYKDEFTANTISVDTNVGGGGCGATVAYGDILNVVAYKNSEGVTSNYVGICNIVSDEFAEKVRKEIKNPNEAYNSVDTNGWQQFHKNNSQTFYADSKHVTKDEYGSYIWVLMNDASTSKSQKTRIHFACKEKMFTVDHEVVFAEFDATGNVLTASNFGRQEQYQWLPLTDVYSKLLSYTC